jgi:CBS domain-containing protein
MIYGQLKEVRDRKVSGLVKPATIIEPEFSVAKTSGIMLKADSYDAYCLNSGQVLTASARELLTSRDMSGIKILPLLHRIEFLTYSSTLEKAARIMSHYRMRSAPVVEDKQIVGAVNARDIIGLLSQQNLRWVPASSILTPDPITIESTESLGMARKIMMSRRIDHLPVLKGGKVSQVLTSMHLLQMIRPGERVGSDMKGVNILRRFESSIGNLGSTRIPNCATNTPLNTVMDSMLKTDTTCCLLTLWENLHGIITYKDLINLLESKIPGEVPLYIAGLPQDMSNAEIVKTKFQKIVRNLIKVYPEVEEARAGIKTLHNPVSQRKHYEVAIRIITPYKSYSYTELGWDISKVFDILGTKIVRNLANRSKRRWKTSIRKIDKREIF